MLVAMVQLSLQSIVGVTDGFLHAFTVDAVSMAVVSIPPLLLTVLAWLAYARSARKGRNLQGRLAAIAKLSLVAIAIFVVLAYGHKFAYYPSTNEIFLTSSALLGFGMLCMVAEAVLLLAISMVAVVVNSIIHRWR